MKRETKKYVRRRKWRYIITEIDIHDVAESEVGRRLTVDEVMRVGKLFENGINWHETMCVAVAQAVEESEAEAKSEADDERDSTRHGRSE